MKAPIAAALALAALAALASPAAADPLAKKDVPPALSGWVSWVLRGHEGELCSFLNGTDQRVCGWPGRLALSLSSSGGSFAQDWRAQAPDWAVLPGNRQRWPLDVQVDGKPAAVVDRGQPMVRLSAGAHRLSGRFSWTRLPDELEVPQETALVSLTLQGAAVPFPVRDDAGRLWLGARAQAAAAQKEQAALGLVVSRELVDEQPLELATRLRLKVSGASRELELGPVLPKGFTPSSLTSPLPARLEEDGRLRVQARAGTWDLTLQARADGRQDAVAAPKPSGPWPSEEVWAFAARPDLRQVEVSGAPSVDPQQTELPPEWRSLPAYLLRPGRTLALQERQRGEAPASADRLTLRRTLWLDFDGKGFSAQDRIQGTLSRGWRLEASPETRLGRVSIGGVDQFLTTLSPGGPAGVEVRERSLDAVADSRVSRGRLTASGWRHDFDSETAVLNLPPGWRIVDAFGVDSAYPTWVSRWTLLDFFLVLIAAGAFSRLFGRRVGVLALCGLALTWHEPGAPQWLWLAALLMAALHGALKDSRRVAVLRWAVWAALALCLVPFCVSQARLALYPDLQYPLSIQPRGPQASDEHNAPVVMRPQETASFRRLFKAKAQGYAGALSSLASSAASYPSYDGAAPAPRAPLLVEAGLDPNARVATGAGLPYWNWTQVQLSWKGPVPQDSPVRFWLLPPWVNFLLAWARILSCALLAAAALGWRPRAGARPPWKAALAALLLLGLFAPPARAGDFPPKDVLDDLRSRLLERWDCQPACAGAGRLVLRAQDKFLGLTLQVSAAAPTAVPLPDGGRDWAPARALLDGKPAEVRRQNGQLWAAVPAGAHELTLDGPLPERDSVSVALPLVPRAVEAHVSGWTLHGLRDDGLPEGALELTRARGASAAAAAARRQGVFPPFLQVERVLRLGLSWTVETRVTRLTPPGTPVAVSIPLLPGEAPASDLRVKDGKAQLVLAPQAVYASWLSNLSQAGALRLSAGQTSLWREVWRVEPGPLWHVEAKGLPPVRDALAGPRALLYRPWPGETLDLTLTRPAAAPGQTLTVDEAALELSPGLRTQDAALRLSLRTSRGVERDLVLPAGAQLLSVSVDGAPQPLRLDGRKLRLSLAPGAHQAAVTWRQAGGARVFYRAPAVDLGVPAVNAHVALSTPLDRWTLLAGGPGMGPAVVFWSYLLVFLLIAYGLSRTGLSPLSTRGWFLLSLGLTQASLLGGALVAGWFLAVGLRGRRAPERPREFKLAQVFLAVLTLMAAVALFSAIEKGLLGVPDMQIQGNGSANGLLRWYVDRASGLLPRPWVLSVPLWVYRAAMLAWALWLAESMLSWARWAWTCYGFGGLWKSGAPAAAPVPPSAPPAEPA